MSASEEIRHSAYTRAAEKSPVWHDWDGHDASVEIVGDDTKRFYASAAFNERKVVIKTPKINRRFRIVFISDLHWSGDDASGYSRFADAISACEADIILFGGDLSIFSDDIDDAVHWLGMLKAKQGKYAVPGNRESCLNWLDYKFWSKAYYQAHFRYLCNEVLELDCITLCGIDDFRFGKPDWSVLNGVDRNHPVITITHNPDAAGSADAGTYLGDIVLCGHTHGGQICLPIIGPLYTSSKFGRQFLHGWKHRNDGTLCLVSNGIGESGFGILHRRVNCPREFVTLDLVPADD